MTGKIQIKRGADSSKLPALAPGELAYVEDTNSLYIGKPSGTGVAKIGGSSGSGSVIAPDLCLLYSFSNARATDTYMTPVDYSLNPVPKGITIHTTVEPTKKTIDRLTLVYGYVYDVTIITSSVSTGTPAANVSIYFDDIYRSIISTKTNTSDLLSFTGLTLKDKDLVITISGEKPESCKSVIVKGWKL